MGMSSRALRSSANSWEREVSRMTHLLVVTIVTVIALHPGAATAQTTIPDAPLCGTCRIITEPLFSFGSFDGPGSLSGPGRVAVDVGGSFWYSDGSVPLIFDAQGRFLRMLGTEGPGPGEYQGVTRWDRLPGDSVLVFDDGNGRAAVLAPNLQVVRYVAMPVSVRGAIVLSWPQRVLVQAYVPTRDLPLHVLDMTARTAAFQASLTTEPGRSLLPGVSPLTQHVLAHSLDSGAWAAEIFNYRLSHWDSEADLVNIWRREAPWFDDPEEGFARHRVQGIHQDDEGRVWVFVHSPREDAAAKVEAAIDRFYPGGRPPSGRFEIPSRELPPPQELYDTIVEVLDTQSGRVVARQRFASLFLALLPDSRAAVYFEDEIGIPRVAIVSLTLTPG